jgi:hypothetical protein
VGNEDDKISVCKIQEKIRISSHVHQLNCESAFLGEYPVYTKVKTSVPRDLVISRKQMNDGESLRMSRVLLIFAVFVLSRNVF